MSTLLTGPELRKSDLRLRSYQTDAIEAIESRFSQGDRSTLLILPTGCHDPAQGILMFDRSVKPAGDVVLGDRLMGMDGTARQVLCLHRGQDYMYRIIPVHGRPFEVTGDHTLTLISRKGAVVDVTVTEWMTWSRSRQQQHRLFRLPGLAVKYGDPAEIKRAGFSAWLIGRGKYAGFTVDGDNRYLMDDCTVTHNCGKTVTFGALAHQWAERGQRTLVLAHRTELIEQAANTLQRIGLEIGIEKAEAHARGLWDPHAVIATVQTMQKSRLQSWPKDYFGLIVTDEAHHATADTYNRIYNHFDAVHLGVTATADRSDDDHLSAVFESVAYELSLWDAMTAQPEPYLSRLKFVQCDVEIDLRQIRTTAGDLNQGDLEDAIRPHIETLANAIKQEVGDRRTLVFTPDVGSSQAMATALNSIGLASQWVAGISQDRQQKVQDFKDGRYQILCNCALLTEGFDCPDIQAIVLCRPTKSRGLYSQMVGRGTRLAQGKTDCLLVDFAWLTRQHDLVKPYELFDAYSADSGVQDLAKKAIAQKAKSGDPADLLEIVAQAREEHKRQTEIKIKARERQVRYKRVSYDPLTAMETLGMPVRREAQGLIGTATDRQKDALRRFGLEAVDTLSRARAGRLLDECIGRARNGLASMKQITHLIRNGVEPEAARGMNRQEASAYLDTVFGGRN